MLSFKAFLILFLSLAVFSGLGIANLLVYFNPVGGPFWILPLFYLFVFVLVFTASFLAFGAVKGSFSGSLIQGRALVAIMREAFLVGILLDLALFFQSLRVLNVYTLVLLVASATILELYFLNR